MIDQFTSTFKVFLNLTNFTLLMFYPMIPNVNPFVLILLTCFLLFVTLVSSAHVKEFLTLSFPF